VAGDSGDGVQFMRDAACVFAHRASLTRTGFATRVPAARRSFTRRSIRTTSTRTIRRPTSGRDADLVLEAMLCAVREDVSAPRAASAAGTSESPRFAGLVNKWMPS